MKYLNQYKFFLFLITIAFSILILSSCKKKEDKYNLAYTEVELGEFEKAIEFYTEAIKEDSQDTNSYINRGTLELKLKRYDEAYDDFTMALSFDTTNHNVYAHLGDLKLEMQEYNKAIGFYNKSTEIYPNNPQIYCNLAFAKTQLGNKEGAIDNYTDAISYDPDYTEAYFNKAMLQQEVGDFTGALRSYQNVIARDEKNIDAHYNKAVLSMRFLNQPQVFGQARASFKRVIQLNDTFAQAYKGLGDYYFVKDSLNLAMANYNKSLELDSLNALAYYGRAVTLIMLSENNSKNLDEIMLNQDYENAIKDFDKSIILNDSNYNAYYFRAYVKRITGDIAGTVEDYTKAAELGKMSAFDSVAKYSKFTVEK